MPPIQQLKFAALLIGIALLAYGIRADSGSVRLAAIIVLAAGLVFRIVGARKQDQR